MKKQFLISLCILILSLPIYSQVYKTINVETPGTLSNLLTEEEKSTITHFTITGTVDSMDFITMRDAMPDLTTLDLSGASTVNDAIYAYALGPKPLLIELVLPPNTKRIGTDAFQNCSFTELVIPPSVTIIQHGAFRYSDILEVTLPSSVRILESYVFASCNSLTAIHVDPCNPEFSSIDGVLFNKDGTVLISFPPAKSGSYSIPSTVTEIMNWGFSECDLIESIYIPSSVTKIGFSFYANTSLNGFQVDPENIFYREIDGVLFTADTSELVQYPLNKSGESYSIPYGTKRLLELSFDGCRLSKILFPNSLTEIENHTFRYSDNLVSINLPPSLKKIEMFAFSYCEGLKSIRIPSSLETIEKDFLTGDNAMDTIIVNSSIPFEFTPGFKYFTHIDTNNCILMVPAGSVAAYGSAPYWKSFQNIIEYVTHFNISEDQFIFESSGGQVTFEISSNTEWQIKSDESWLHFSDTIGMDNKIITITVSSNAGAERQSTVAVSPLEKEELSLVITQAGLGTSVKEVPNNNEKIFYDRIQQSLNAINLSGQNLSLYSTEGRLIYSSKIKEDHRVISTSSLPDGIYIVRSGSYAVKIAISR